MKREAEYVWEPGWPALGDEPSLAEGWSHTGVALTHDGIVVGASREPGLVLLDAAGAPRRRVATPDFVEVHGLSLVHADGQERLWVADSGGKDRALGPDVDWTPSPRGGRVAEVDLAGRTLRVLPRPELAAYADSVYQPTSVAVDERRFGGAGDVWVADGYGASLVHRFDDDARYRSTLTGEEGAGRFDCPHTLLIDRRRDEPELYVADRGNRRIQVFDLAGRYRRSFGDDVLAGPSGLATVGGRLVVADLTAARLTVFDERDRLVSHLFANPNAPGRGPWPDAWPNARDDAGNVVRPDLRPYVFNSPHGVAADAHGNLFVTEWVLGARFVKLAPHARG